MEKQENKHICFLSVLHSKVDNRSDMKFVHFLEQAAQEKVKENFQELIAKHNIFEEEKDAEAKIKERLHKAFAKLVKQYCEANDGCDEEFAERFVQAVELKDPDVLDKYNLVATLASVLYEEDPADLELHEADSNVLQPHHKFIMQFVKALSARNKDATVNIFDALLEFFLPDSVHRKEYLHMLVYSDCWSAFNALKMAQHCCGLTVDLGTKLLHKAKTYGVEFQKTYATLTEDDPLDALTKTIKSDGDKSLDLVMSEMRKAGVPDEMLNKVEEIVSKVNFLCDSCNAANETRFQGLW